MRFQEIFVTPAHGRSFERDQRGRVSKDKVLFVGNFNGVGWKVKTFNKTFMCPPKHF